MRYLRMVLGVVMLTACLGVPAGMASAGCEFGPMAPMGYEQLTVSTTALGFTAAKMAPAGADPASLAVVIVETNAVRYRNDGLAPTASVGMPLAVGLTLEVCGPLAISRTRFIRQTADGTLNVVYYRRGDQ